MNIEIKELAELLRAGNTTTHRDATPYEIITKVGQEMDSKGTIKPDISVTITRRLESGDQIETLIKADIARGVIETQDAVKQIIANNKCTGMWERMTAQKALNKIEELHE